MLSTEINRIRDLYKEINDVHRRQLSSRRLKDKQTATRDYQQTLLLKSCDIVGERFLGVQTIQSSNLVDRATQVNADDEYDDNIEHPMSAFEFLQQTNEKFSPVIAEFQNIQYKPNTKERAMVRLSDWIDNFFHMIRVMERNSPSILPIQQYFFNTYVVKPEAGILFYRTMNKLRCFVPHGRSLTGGSYTDNELMLHFAVAFNSANNNDDSYKTFCMNPDDFSQSKLADAICILMTRTALLRTIDNQQNKKLHMFNMLETIVAEINRFLSMAPNQQVKSACALAQFLPLGYEGQAPTNTIKKETLLVKRVFNTCIIWDIAYSLCDEFKTRKGFCSEVLKYVYMRNTISDDVNQGPFLSSAQVFPGLYGMFLFWESTASDIQNFIQLATKCVRHEISGDIGVDDTLLTDWKLRSGGFRRAMIDYLVDEAATHTKHIRKDYTSLERRQENISTTLELFLQEIYSKWDHGYFSESTLQEVLSYLKELTYKATKTYLPSSAINRNRYKLATDRERFTRNFHFLRQPFLYWIPNKENVDQYNRSVVRVTGTVRSTIGSGST